MTEEMANTPETVSRTERAFVEVGKKPRPIAAFAWWFLAALLALAVLSALFNGNLTALAALIPLPYMRGLAKQAAAATKTQIVWVTISVSEENVIIDMPGSRLYNGEYVDQRYICNRASIDSMALEEQVFHLKARSMQSIVSRAGVQLAFENLTYTEVSFRLDATGRERIGRLLAENGYAASSSVG